MNKNIHYYILLGIVALLIVVVIFCREKTGYIDNNRLLNEFEATKLLILKSEEQLSALYNELEVVSNNLKLTDSLYKKNQADSLLFRKEYLKYVKDSISYNYKKEMNDHTSKIRLESWNLLNEYILEYGKKYRYDFIYGANGEGNLMYASEGKDITDKVIEFSNKKYNGK